MMIFSANRQTSVMRQERRGGRDFLVVPVVALIEGVLNGELVPADEIAASVASWNGRPVTIGHPIVEGVNVTANTPEMFDKYTVGQLYNAVFEDGRLKGELWLDLNKAPLVDDGPLILERLQGSGELEVSTAYNRTAELEPGEHDGEAYSSIAHALRPDHLAILPHSEGACSWADGCGTPRVNDRDDMECNVLEAARTPTFDGVTDGSWEKPTLGQYIDAYPGEKPDTNRVAELPQEVRTWIADHTLLGDAKADNERALTFFAVVGTDDRLNAGALRAVLGGRGAQANIPVSARDSAQAKARLLLDEHFRREQTVNDNWVTQALQKIMDVLKINREVNDMMSREEMVALLSAAGLAFDEAELDTMSDSALGRVMAFIETLQEEPEEATPPDEETVEGQEGEEVMSNAQITDILSRLGTLESARTAEARGRKDAIIDNLVANGCDVRKDELAKLDEATLTALQDAVTQRSADYRGQSGSQPATGSDDYQLPALF